MIDHRRRPRRAPANPSTRRLDTQRGSAVVELAIVIPMFVMIVLTGVDLGRTAQYQNRVLNAAREGAAVAQVSPTAVDAGCKGDRNVTDRTRGQNTSLTNVSGFAITVAKKDANGTLRPYTGCGAPTNAVTVAPGDRVVVTVNADVSMSGPVTSVILGRTMHITRSVEVVVQG